MKTIVALVFPLLLTVGVPLAMVGANSRRVPATAPAVFAAAPILPPAPAPVPIAAATDDPGTAQYRHLRDHVLGVMRSWPKGSKELPTADLNDIASDVAAAVLSEPETVELATGKSCDMVRDSGRCFWPNGWSSDGDKAVLLASLAYYEGSRFAEYVDASRCTDKEWRKVHAHAMRIGGECDGGYAHTLWQIHPFRPAPTATIYPVCDVSDVDTSRFGAARCALEIARKSISGRDNLTLYTGENDYDHPKADERLNFARETIRKHPYHD